MTAPTTAAAGDDTPAALPPEAEAELPRHGTQQRYVKYKCRCGACRARNAAYQRDYRSRRKQRGTSVAGDKIPAGLDSIGRQVWRASVDPKDKLLSHVAAGPNACIVWTGSKNNHGYGRLYVNGQQHYAHRLSFEVHVGAIPDGLVLDHLCRNRACINPHHLEPVTAEENTRRGAEAITHCPQGHPYDEANTRRRPRGSRECRACGRARDRARHTPAGLGWPIHSST